MTSSSLDSLRRDIDLIDDQIHDLLMHRAAVVERIGEVKVKQALRVYIRPEREATLLRRLVGRRRGRFPAPAVVRIWREVLAATSRLQGPFSVAVHAPENSIGYWDLARNQYGSCTPMRLHRTAKSVIREVIEGSATVAVLPLPDHSATDPWWPLLVATDERIPRIIARLPFIETGDGERLGALAIAQHDQEKTGDDVSFAAVEAGADLSRASLEEAFDAAALPAKDISVWSGGDDPETRMHLIEIADFVGRSDARAVAVAKREHISRVIVLGGYAMPLGRLDGQRDG